MRCSIFFRGLAAEIASTFFFIGWIPSLLMTWPKYSTTSWYNWHLLQWAQRPYFSSWLKTSSTFAKCCSSVSPVMSISSRYHTTWCSLYKILSIIPWRITGQDATPYGNCIYWYNRLFVLMVVKLLDSSSNMIWL